MADVSNDASGYSAETNSVKPGAALSFEESLARLERIARDLEEGDLGLDAALARYQEGVACLRECRRMLERSERKIELLMGVTDSGEAITAPFDDGPIDALSIASPENAVARGRRRSAASAPKSGKKRSSPADGASNSIANPSESPSSTPDDPNNDANPEVDVDSPKRLF